MATTSIAEATAGNSTADHTNDDQANEAMARLSSAESILLCLECAINYDGGPASKEVQNAMSGVRTIITDASKMFGDAYFSQRRAQA